MTQQEQLLQCDAERRQAMIDADERTLDRLLADELTWTHSSGATESKAEFIAAISSGAVSYAALEVEQDQVRSSDQLLVHNGVLRGRASRDGQEKLLNAKFLAIWCVFDEQMRLIAWQSTNFSD
ncbi:MAG: nuclear transport factor 2 family protein [Pseudomonadales bacterium]